MHPLEPINWRIERADKHLATLNRERDAVLDEKNRSILGHFEHDTGEYVFRFGGKLANPGIGIIVSEFAHHLRSALDNLVWQLVLLRGGSPTRRTEFPIYESQERYQSSLWRLHGISADDRALIEAVQPYKLGAHAQKADLSLLAWLNNVDKHRFVHVSCAFPVRVAIQVSYGAEGEFAGFFPWNPLLVQDVRKILDVRYLASITSDDRAELARVRIEASGPDPQMKMQSDAPLEVALSDPQHLLTLTDLSRIRQYVVWIIDRFRPRFNVVRRLS